MTRLVRSSSGEPGVPRMDGTCTGLPGRRSSAGGLDKRSRRVIKLLQMGRSTMGTYDGAGRSLAMSEWSDFGVLSVSIADGRVVLFIAGPPAG